MQWFGYFLMALALSSLGCFAVVQWRKTSKKKFAKRFGGIAVAVSFALCVLFNPELEKTLQLKGLLLGTFLLVGFGFLDDIKNFSWKKQLSFQVFLALILIATGYSIDYFANPFGGMIRLDGWQIALGEGGWKFSFWGAMLILFWTVCVMNAINWADGTDGLAGGIAMVGGLALFWISLSEQVNQPAIAILSAIFVGAILGFWRFNFPRGKIELGTAGSYFVGFFLSSAAIISGTKIATAMIVLALPLVDFFWVIFERIRAKKRPVSRDFNHLHHKLLKLGWSNQRIVFSYVSFLFAMLFLSFFAQSRIAKLSVVLVEICLVAGFLYIIGLRRNFCAEKQKNKENED